MNSVELYHKLRPYLHIKVLDNGLSGALDRMRRYPGREMLSVDCTGHFLWGHYYARVAWGPSFPPRKYCGESTRIGEAPTYEQFCMWYRLRWEEA